MSSRTIRCSVWTIEQLGSHSMRALPPSARTLNQPTPERSSRRSATRSMLFDSRVSDRVSRIDAQWHEASAVISITPATSRPKPVLFISPAGCHLRDGCARIAATRGTDAGSGPCCRSDRRARAGLRVLRGVTGITVPDQLKSAVARSCRCEPGLQRSYADMARHYGTAVVPARPRSASGTPSMNRRPIPRRRRSTTAPTWRFVPRPGPVGCPSSKTPGMGASLLAEQAPSHPDGCAGARHGSEQQRKPTLGC